MNFIAEEQTCFVVYPAQRREGKPGEDAGTGFAQPISSGAEVNLRLSRHYSPIMRDYSPDPKRVYVGDCRRSGRGCCHGSHHPDLVRGNRRTFRPACGIASDLPSAFVAMRRGDLAASSGTDNLSDGPLSRPLFSWRSRHYGASKQRRSN
jgi:hypothetical protein